MRQRVDAISGVATGALTTPICRHIIRVIRTGITLITPDTPLTPAETRRRVRSAPLWPGMAWGCSAVGAVLSTPCKRCCRDAAPGLPWAIRALARPLLLDSAARLLQTLPRATPHTRERETGHEGQNAGEGWQKGRDYHPRYGMTKGRESGGHTMKVKTTVRAGSVPISQLPRGLGFFAQPQKVHSSV